MTDKTTPPDTILRGKNGHIAALSDTSGATWQFKESGCFCDWYDFKPDSDSLARAYNNNATQWRLRPAKEEREAMRFAENVWLNCVRHTFRTRDGLSFTVTADKDGPWDEKRVRITVEEITDKDDSE